MAGKTMCGILAILNFDPENQVDEPLLRQMTDTMAHRGPDDSSYWINGPVGLGNRRLAVIDLSPSGRQPMNNENGDLWITYNGEIYNFKELRRELEMKGHSFRSHTDTEVVLHAYEEWGTECLRRFNGMWAFALWDNRNRYLFVARDRLGVKPLVYYHDPKRFICASEIKGIVADQTVPKEINPESLHHYLSLMNIPAPLTIYKGIRKLRPGHYLLIQEGRIEDRVYWDLPIGEEVS
jgi:asparagine synthase (glutamine-hydrolysing)